MIRLTGGEWNGRLIKVPPGDRTRPTASKVREALFDILQARIPGARFVDLCCGAGTVGLEALSRGAAHAVFVESSQRTVALLRDNLARLVVPSDRCTVWDISAVSWANGDGPGGDIVFCDPPYRSPVLARLLPLVAERGKVLPGGWLIVEVAKQADLSGFDLPGFTPARTRHYGDTSLWLWNRSEASQ
jgi:16S rRNA (guanine966-N2)-methyltransferase